MIEWNFLTSEYPLCHKALSIFMEIYFSAEIWSVITDTKFHVFSAPLFFNLDYYIINTTFLQ